LQVGARGKLSKTLSKNRQT